MNEPTPEQQAEARREGWALRETRNCAHCGDEFSVEVGKPFNKWYTLCRNCLQGEL